MTPSSALLSGLRVVTIALNLPGPAACARLRDLGASVTKVEPPAGDPFEQYCPSWYARLHATMAIERIDLKSLPGRAHAAGPGRLSATVTTRRPESSDEVGVT